MDQKTNRLSTPRATFSYTVENGVVCIVDLDYGKSVTNDADNVVADIAAAGVDISAHPVIYCDSTGIWDQLLIRDGRFADFRIINEPDKAAAIAKAKAA